MNLLACLRQDQIMTVIENIIENVNLHVQFNNTPTKVPFSIRLCAGEGSHMPPDLDLNVFP
jgi:hypothetical protein